MPIHREVDYVTEGGACHTPSFYVDSRAARMLAGVRTTVAEECEISGEWEHQVGIDDIFGIDDPNNRYDAVTSLAGKCEDVASLRLNGLLVVMPRRRGGISRRNRGAVMRLFESHGLDPEYGKKLYTTFGDAALDVAENIALAMLGSCTAHGRQEIEPAKPHPLDSFARFLGVGKRAEELESLMLKHGVSEARLLELVKERERREEGIRYIADEYEVDGAVARRVYASLDSETGGMVDADVLKKMDLTLSVEAAKHSAGARHI